MLKKVLLGLAAIFVLFLAIVALQPSEFRVERTQQIQAPPEVVFASINDFHRWAGWSPWEKLDPEMKRTFEGSPSGQGAVYSWTGNDKVGEGRMTLTESRPNELIRIKLEFIKPWTATNTTEFTFKPVAGGMTEVWWSMVGHNDFMGKAFGLFMNMDKMVGGDFDKGLLSVKSLSEAEAKSRAEASASAAAAAEAPAAAPAAGKPAAQ